MAAFLFTFDWMPVCVFLLFICAYRLVFVLSICVLYGCDLVLYMVFCEYYFCVCFIIVY